MSRPSTLCCCEQAGSTGPVVLPILAQRWLQILTLVAVTLAMGHPLAQKLPAPSRSVYKCESGGKVVYSDAPCLGAKRVDVEPTRGLNKDSGTERIGGDVRQERLNEQMAEALHPILGETPQERAKRLARAKLSPDARAECAKLDGDILATEAQEASRSSASLPATQANLLRMRRRYRDLRC